jgi:two-component system sensor histidine kinase ChiS
MTQPVTVLVVDDDPISLHLVRDLLQDAGFRVRTTTSPAGALRAIEEEPPDLLLADLRMPEMSGLDLLRAGRHLVPGLCGLIITAFATEETTREVFQAGAQDLISKPVNDEELKARLRHAAEVVELRREVQSLRLAAQAATASSVPAIRLGRAQELALLPALPGSGVPLEAGGREDTYHRLERLAALFRQGLVSALEFEEKKRTLLAEL